MQETEKEKRLHFCTVGGEIQVSVKVCCCVVFFYYYYYYYYFMLLMNAAVIVVSQCSFPKLELYVLKNTEIIFATLCFYLHQLINIVSDSQNNLLNWGY